MDLSKVLNPYQFQNKDLSILIFSDAGAGHNIFSLKRINLTLEWLKILKIVTPKIVWLNPFPKDRWADSSASAIAEYVQMFEANEEGLKKAINIFRGKTLATSKDFH